MRKNPLAEEYSQKETQRRLQSVLRGAFDGQPTPLKNIPKKSGESRKPRRKPTEPKSA
jgi:hypothetical protein